MEIIVLRQIKLYESLQWINKTRKKKTEKMRRKNINWKRTRRNKGADVHNTGIKNDVNNWIYIFYAVFSLLLLKFVMRIHCAEISEKRKLLNWNY